VTAFKPGDRVIGSLVWGGMVEKVTAAARRCTPMPDAMPFDEASALVFTYGTSIHALKDRARLEPGETLLVLGAAGGVGLSAVELGKAMGARVIAAASTPEKVDLARKHGADAGVVYPPGPFDKAGARALADLFKGACGERGADVIYDPVGGDYTEAALRSIAWEGRLLVVGFPAGIPKLPLNLTLLKGCQVVGVFWGGFSQRDPKANAANIAELMQLYAQGKIRPLVSERYPLARAGEAIARLAGRQAMGKIVVTMG
jgi:NADPH2:quinone reductase